LDIGIHRFHIWLPADRSCFVIDDVITHFRAPIFGLVNFISNSFHTTTQNRGRVWKTSTIF
jgi:hypothetical protein